MSPKGPPLSFLLFCYRMRVYKSESVPQKNVLRFLSLRYSADLRRSRLVRILRSFRLPGLRANL